MRRSRQSLAWLLCVAAGCGRINFDGLSRPQGDGAVSSDTGVDGPAVLGPFGPPQPIAELDLAGENDDPSLTGDMLEIIFSRTLTAGDGDVWHATRTSVADPFGAPAAVVELNSSGNENTPDISPDGLTIYFSSNRDGAVDIWMSTRATRLDAWAVPTKVLELSTSQQDVGLQVTSDGLWAVLNRDPAASSIWDLYITSRASAAATWSAPVPITELNTAARESDGWLAPDHLELWFASDEPGTAGLRDLWVTRRTSETSMFEAPARVPEVDSASDDVDPWLSSDRRTLVFASDRGGTLNLYTATR